MRQEARRRHDLLTREACGPGTETHVSLQICFSSRHYPTVVVDKGIELMLEREDGKDGGLQSYFKSKLRIEKSKAAQSLMSNIFPKSARIFLWSSWNSNPQLRVSEKLRIHKDMRKRLDEILNGLVDLFEMILMRDNDNLDQLQVCRKWILFAVRPLSPQELYFAIQFAFDDSCDGYWNEDDLDLGQMKAFFRSSSKGLEELTGGKNLTPVHPRVRAGFLAGQVME